jgi:phosphoribosylanthranilate isomerase
MSAPAIKICGLSTPDTLEAAIAARADHAGFVFVERSPRHVSLATAADLSRRASGRIGRVGLFVDAPAEHIHAAIAATGLDVLQLHGEESPAHCAALRQATGLAVWKALPIAARSDLDRVNAYVGAVDLVLLDAKTPKGMLPGGMGLSFDWSLLTGWKAPVAWGLAGGISPANVAEALAATGAPLLDVSSGVENVPGIKDPVLIAAFCAAARG